MANILITGGAGFIGSTLAIRLKKRLKKASVMVLDNLRRRGSELNLKRLKENKIHFVHGDIRNPADLRFKSKFSLIIECSADASVTAGLSGEPNYIFDTNLKGLFHCLELARRDKAGLVFLSTSRVYPIKRLKQIKIVEKETRFEISEDQRMPGISPNGVSEDFPLDGAKSLYGATKFASELFIQEYVHNYGLKAVINRCGVVAGPWQMGKIDQGFLAYWLLAHCRGEPLKYIGFGGKGKQVRDVLHVDDLSDLVLRQIGSLSKLSGEVFNVGGGWSNAISLCEATRLCQKVTKKRVKVSKEIKPRKADIPIYVSDNHKVNKKFGWKPRRSCEDILKDLYAWIKTYGKNIEEALY